MTLDTTAEESNTLARLRGHLWSGRVYDEVPEEAELAIDETTGLVLPYIILTFGVIFPANSSRSVEGAAEQPHMLPMVAECWGATTTEARAGASGVIRLLTGWSPNETNAGEYELSGGGRFTSYDQGRPARRMRQVSGACMVNMSIHDDAITEAV